MIFQTEFACDVEYFERRGSGTTLLLLHGIGSNALSFAALLAELPADWRVIAWNAPGYGRSKPLPKPWPVARDYAETLGMLVDHLDLRDFLLVGHSLGALMAASFALLQPQRIRRLVLTAPAIGHGVVPGSELSAASLARITDLARMGAEALAIARAPRLVFEPERHPAMVAQVAGAMAKVDLAGYTQASRMLSSGRLLDDAARLPVMTDVVYGAQDLVTPPENARQVHQALPPARCGSINEIPDTGHALYLQTPAAFARLLEASALTSPGG
jgi:pimeloyl-ACP methyl ester carboxylesterase